MTLLDDGFLVPIGRPDVIDVGRRGDRVLSLAVVAESGGLDDSGRAYLGDRNPQFVERGGPGKGRGRETTVGEKHLLARPLLGGVQRRAATA